MDKEREIKLTEQAVLEVCPHSLQTSEYTSGIGCADRGVECDCFCRQARIIEAMIKAGYRKIIPNVDFVVRAGELATMREKAYNEGRKETAKEILQDVKSTLAILMVHGEYCDDWNCGKVIEFIDKVINPVETKYGIEVDE